MLMPSTKPMAMEAGSEPGASLARAAEGQAATKTHYDLRLHCTSEENPQASEEAEAE